MITNITMFVTLMQFGSMMQIASIDGQVRDARTRKALAMVRIELVHQGIPCATIFTDIEGRFRLPNVVPGTYMLYADSTGYEPKSVDIDSMMDWRIDVELNRKVDRTQSGSPVVSLNDLAKRPQKSGYLRRLLMKLR